MGTYPFKKTDLHCHGFLSVPLKIYEQVAGRVLPPLPKVFESFEIFNQYIFQNLVPLISNKKNLRTLIAGAFQRLVEDGVVYSEMSFDIMVADLLGLSASEFAEILVEEKSRVSEVTIAPEIGMNRKLPPDEAFQKVKEWIETGIFQSIDLYDDESYGHIEDFVPVYQLAKEKGLKLKAHVGEFGSADSVRKTVEVLDLDAVQHGIRAVDDPRVMEFLAKRGTVLNICPTSNVALGACFSYETHPAKRLFDASVKITVNSDDLTLFGVTVSQELENLKKMGFSEHEIKSVVENGLTAFMTL